MKLHLNETKYEIESAGIQEATKVPEREDKNGKSVAIKGSQKRNDEDVPLWRVLTLISDGGPAESGAITFPSATTPKPFGKREALVVKGLSVMIIGYDSYFNAESVSGIPAVSPSVTK